MERGAGSDGTTLREIDLGPRRISFAIRSSSRARVLRADIGLRSRLRVTLPRGMPESVVEPFLRSRSRWILRTLKRFERLAAVIPDRELVQGARVPFLGTDLTLDVVEGPPRVGRLGDSLIVSVRKPTERRVRSALERWYRAEAGRELGDRARSLAARHGLRVAKVTVRNQRTRWGSCSPSGALSFNWRLLLGPAEIADYLVAHELAHLAEPNHSPRFWSRVGELCPAWRERERWLRTFGPGLVL